MTNGEQKPRATAPRDQGGSIELKEGTGGILAMCPCDNYLEIYKKDVTFRIEMPDNIDPARTNPNALTVATVADRIGCADPVVARVLLQGRDMLDSAFLIEPVDKKSVVRSLHSIKEGLVACRKSSDAVRGSVEKIVAKSEQAGINRDRFGRSIPNLPQVPDLEIAATQFLISSKRSISSVCALVPFFIETDRSDNNFDHLGERLEKLLGADAPLTTFVREHAAGVRHLIELRNAQEHPQPSESTRIENFRVQPDGSIRVPQWYVTGQAPEPIHTDMSAAIDFLIEVTEGLLVCLIDHRLDPRWPFIIEEHAAAAINPDLPVRYRLTIDMSKVELAKSGDGEAS